ISEVIIATDPNTEGEATASYLGLLLKEFLGLTVSRLASGLPMGGDLEFVGALTLSRACAGRTQLKLEAIRHHRSAPPAHPARCPLAHAARPYYFAPVPFCMVLCRF